MSMLMRLAAAGKARSFTSFSTEYTSTGTQTVSIPAGATTVTIECIGAGYKGQTLPSEGKGGGGGGYSKRNTYSVAGLSGIYISVPAPGTTTNNDAFTKENNSVGTTICLAEGGNATNGGTTATAVGDVKYTGGNGRQFAATSGGGGAAGPSGNGGTATTSAGGTSGGSPAGVGGDGGVVGITAPTNGSNFGGGGGANEDAFAQGAQGWVKLTWN